MWLKQGVKQHCHLVAHHTFCSKLYKYKVELSYDWDALPCSQLTVLLVFVCWVSYLSTKPLYLLFLRKDTFCNCIQALSCFNVHKTLSTAHALHVIRWDYHPGLNLSGISVYFGMYEFEWFSCRCCGFNAFCLVGIMMLQSSGLLHLCYSLYIKDQNCSKSWTLLCYPWHFCRYVCDYILSSL